MRPSAVIQGVKEWVARLNPQLHLTPTESQRLLTALKTSFRERLDEVPAAPKNESGVQSRIRIENLQKQTEPITHSFSARLADGHLASLLTNPLLSVEENDRKLNYARAKAALARTSSDPIALLEEYESRGAASDEICLLCLRTLIASQVHLSEKQKRETLHSTQPGRRLLKWLHTARKIAESFSVDQTSHEIVDLLMPVMVAEGSENLFIEYLLTGIWHEEGSHGVGVIRRVNSLNYNNSWRTQSFMKLLRYKLRESKTRNANAGLDLYFRAFDLRNANNTGDTWLGHLVMVASRILEYYLTRSAVLLATDVTRFERFCRTLESWRGVEHRFIAYSLAWLALAHPRSPDAQPAFALWQEAIDANPDESRSHVSSTFQKPISEMERRKGLLFLQRTASQLYRERRVEDAKWVLEAAHKRFPALGVSAQEDEYAVTDIFKRSPRSLEEQRLNYRPRPSLAV